MNLLHPRWDGLRENLMVGSILLTILGWALAPTEMPWWWALIPTGVTLALLWWEAAAMHIEAPPPLPPGIMLGSDGQPKRRNRIGQLLPLGEAGIRRGRPPSPATRTARGLPPLP